MFAWNPTDLKASARDLNVHISEVTSKFNDEHLIIQKDSFCRNSDTEKELEYNEDDESFEIHEASENLDSSRSKNKVQSFDKINKLGEKRRSKSINNNNNVKEKSYISEDYNVDSSQRKWSIGAMPVGFAAYKGMIPKLKEWTNTITKYQQKVRSKISFNYS